MKDPYWSGGKFIRYLMNDFVESIILDRTPIVNIAAALNMTVTGIVAHQSALRDGEMMKIPRFSI